MKIRIAAVAAAALALTACGGQTKPAAIASDTSPSSAAPSSAAPSSADTSKSVVSSESTASPAVAAVKGEKPPREFLIGKWGTNGDCTLAIDLRADGTSDGPFGNWSYTDGVIGFADEPDFKVNVTVLDDNTMESTNATSDKTSKMTRCP